jgi:8-oxo-dGTP pyrophosphatase MutT (NUDIX family)
MANIIKTHIVSGMVLFQNDKFLLVQENNPKCYGEWNWPAGHVDEGYSIEATAIKEAQEETGFDCEIVKKIDIFQKEKDEYVPMHLFLGKITGGKLKIDQKEILDAKWFSLEEILTLNMRDPWVINGAKAIALNYEQQH